MAERRAGIPRRVPTGWDEAGIAAGVLAYGVVLQRVIPERWHLPANAAAALAAFGMARHAGVSAAGCGLGAGSLGRGLRAGSAAAAAIIGVVTIASVPARTRGLFSEERISGHSSGQARYEALVRIPLATAAGEEVLFRGALLGIMLQRHPAAEAVARASLCFGAWHALPALDSLRRAAFGRAASQRAGAAPTVIGAVAVTAGAGAGLAALRLRTASVVAPVLAHAALNVTAYLVARRAGLPPGRAAVAGEPGTGGPGAA